MTAKDIEKLLEQFVSIKNKVTQGIKASHILRDLKAIDKDIIKEFEARKAKKITKKTK